MSRRAVVGASLAIIAAVAALAIGHEWTRPAYIEKQLEPQAMYQDPGGDPRVLGIGVLWKGDGWCSGQFTAKVVETTLLVEVPSVTDREYLDGNCAGLGTVDGLGWATVTLQAPLGKRAVLRSSDRVMLPMDVRPLAPGNPQSADVQRFGGLNDSPPSALQRAARLDGAQAGTLASLLEGLPPFPAEAFFCPSSDGSYYLVNLRYSNGADRQIRIERNGCESVFLGASQQPARWAVNDAALYDFLDRVAGQ